MKTRITLILFLTSIFSFAQEAPQIFLVTANQIIGANPIGNEVFIDIDTDNNEDYIIPVDSEGKFSFDFPTPLTVGTEIQVWSEYQKRNLKLQLVQEKTKVEKYKVLDKDGVMENYAGMLATLSEEEFAVNKLNFKSSQLKNTVLSYRAKISNSYFQIPAVRFNFVDDENKIGDINIFNSVGAGFGISWGRMEITRDNNGEIINQDFSSTFGLHLGALFSAGTGDDAKNVFAPTFNVSLLDFQVGYGYELGSISENQERHFITLAYSIPLYKLVKNSFRIWTLDPVPYASSQNSLE